LYVITQAVTDYDVYEIDLTKKLNFLKLLVGFILVH